MKSHADTLNRVTLLVLSSTEAIQEFKSMAPSRPFTVGPALELGQLGFQCYSSNGPIPQGDGAVMSPQDPHFSGDNIDPDNMFDDGTFVVGRPSEAILDIVQEGLDHINAYLTDLVAHSGQPPQQIIDQFLKQHARSNPTNDWNSYSKYFTQHTEQELARLWNTGEFSGSVDSTPCKGTLNRLPYSNQITAVTVHKKCYELFKKQYPATWQEILTKFKESTQYTEIGKTIAQWQQLFNKSVKQFTQSVSFYTTGV